MVTYAAVGGGALALILVIVACCLCVCLRRRKKETYLPPKLTAAQERDLMFGKVRDRREWGLGPGDNQGCLVFLEIQPLSFSSAGGHAHVITALATHMHPFAQRTSDDRATAFRMARPCTAPSTSLSTSS